MTLSPELLAMIADVKPASDAAFNLHMQSDESRLGLTLNKLRLLAFKSGSKQEYYDALSYAFQNGLLVTSQAALSALEERGS